jgi:hypothetical protein
MLVQIVQCGKTYCMATGFSGHPARDIHLWCAEFYVSEQQ